MKSASISELKNRLSAFLDMVRAGESVVVLDRDQPIAIIERIAVGGSADARASRLERAGLLRPPLSAAALDLEAFRQPPRASASVLEALIQERREGR